ncbi:LysR substrate-binding domain-containing protein, partial [Rhodopseudomonas sp. B29]|uniref:LysR substrate-binding domain-containing protein n=1 Tax=Rhodopseudomonas sp. B29 TaxID=95607 RepID=UPI0003B51B4C
PTFSRKLMELEDHLGTRLLTRTTRRLELTDAGSGYVAACRRIIEDVSEAERRAAGEYVAPKGELVITAPIVFGRLHVLPVVTAFLAMFPEIDVRLVLSDRNVSLLDDHIDVAVRIGALRDSSMIATQVGAVRWVVCGSQDYFAAHGVPRTPTDLANHACVSFEGAAAAAPWSFKAKGKKTAVAVPVRARLSVNSAEAALDAAAAGAGITRVLSYQAAAAVSAGKLKIVLSAFEPEPFPVSLLYLSQGVLPLKMRSFIDFAAPRLRAALGGLSKPAGEARRRRS